MKIFSYIWLFSIWLTLTLVTGPKENGSLKNFVENAQWADYILGTLINSCYVSLIFVVILMK